MPLCQDRIADLAVLLSTEQNSIFDSHSIYVSLCNDQCSSVRLSVHLAMSWNLTLDFSQRLWYWAKSKLVWLWPPLGAKHLYHWWWPFIVIKVTGSAFMKYRQYQYFKNGLCHEHETWYCYNVYEVYVTYTGFVWLFCIQGEIIDVRTEILMLGLFQRLWYQTSSKFVWL